MSLTTRYAGQIIIAENPSDVVFGTVMLGNSWGQVISANLVREADVEEVIAAGSLLAVIQQNPKFEFSFETMFRAQDTAPGLAQKISFPFAGIDGRIMPPITVNWEQAQHRGLQINATSWDPFSGTNNGAGAASEFNGTGYMAITEITTSESKPSTQKTE